MIRTATPLDEAAVREVNNAAFGRPDEAKLVDQLRSGGDALVELVAEENGRIVGHILFSRLLLHGSDVLQAAALGPMSIEPGRQRSGLGSRLVEAGLAACRERGTPAVVVLGHPDFYPRFGFSAQAAERLKALFRGPPFMALELTKGALRKPRVVQYGSAFGLEAWFVKHRPEEADEGMPRSPHRGFKLRR